MSPRGIQPDHSILSGEEQDSILIEGSDPEGGIIINQAPKEEIFTMVVVKFSDRVEGSGDNIDAPSCTGIYK